MQNTLKQEYLNTNYINRNHATVVATFSKQGDIRVPLQNYLGSILFVACSAV